jgi:hypothetical protein
MKSNHFVLDGNMKRFIVSVLLGGLVLAEGLRAQTSTYTGDKAAYLVSTTLTNAHDYIDASVYIGTAACSSTTDVCCPISQALADLASTSNNYKKSGTVDLRGIIPPSASTHLTCSTTNNPWTGSSGLYNNIASTILLPAGTIDVSGTLVLPATTRIIGEGANLTTINAASGFTASDGYNAIAEMGTFGGSGICGNNDCNGVVLEHLGINANGQSLNAIVNNSAQELNYVNDVAISGVATGGIGLWIIGQNDVVGTTKQGYAVNSGPYSNIYFTGASSGSGACVNINGTYGTRGIRGLTCVAPGTAGSAAILLDGNNNTIEDVYISNFTDGVLIGSQIPSGATAGYAQNNLLFNIRGSSTVTHLVHICKSLDSSPCPTGTNNSPPTDLTLMGITSAANTTIQDDVTGATLTNTGDPTVGLYILGEPVLGGSLGATPIGSSRFTTSNSYPAWFVGSSPGSGNTCTVNGTLYSVTSGTTAPTLLGCINLKWDSLSGIY